MAYKVFSLYDSQEHELCMFTAPIEQLDKDVVAAFLVKNESKFFNSEQKKQADKLQSVISETTSLDELKSALVGWDFQLEMIQVD